MPEAPITTPLVNDRGRTVLVNVWTRFGTERKMVNIYTSEKYKMNNLQPEVGGIGQSAQKQELVRGW